MRAGEVTAVAPLDSPELSPATSYAVVFLPSPVCLSVAWGPLVSRRAEGGSQPRLRRVWAALASLARVCGPPDLFGPAQQVELGFQIHFCFILFTDLCRDSKICIS